MYVTVGALTRSSSTQTIIGGLDASRVFYVSETNLSTFYYPTTLSSVWSLHINGVVHSVPGKRAALSPSLFLSKYAVIAISNAEMLHATFDTVYIGRGVGTYFYGNMTNIVLAESISEETQGEVTSYMANKSGVLL